MSTDVKFWEKIQRCFGKTRMIPNWRWIEACHVQTEVAVIHVMSCRQGVQVQKVVEQSSAFDPSLCFIKKISLLIPSFVAESCSFLISEDEILEDDPFAYVIWGRRWVLMAPICPLFAPYLCLKIFPLLKYWLWGWSIWWPLNVLPLLFLCFPYNSLPLYIKVLAEIWLSFQSCSTGYSQSVAS